jgi:hypothetical protein
MSWIPSALVFGHEILTLTFLFPDKMEYGAALVKEV